MSAQHLLEWARKMGYPGVDSPEFQENIHRLCIPNTKPIWHHLINCVKPTSEVCKMRKQLLCYKLSVEGNPTQEALEKFDNVMDYECYLKKKNLEAKIENQYQQIEQKKKQIEIMTIKKLKESDARKRADAALLKDKLERLRLLRLKNTEILNCVREFQELQAMITEDFIYPTYTTLNGNAELSRLISSLDPGHELEQLCSNLTFSIRTLAEFIQSETRSSHSSMESENVLLHRTLEEDLSTMKDKLAGLVIKRNKLAEELSEKKREFSDPTNLDLVQRLKATFIQNGRLDALISVEKQMFLKSWVINNANLTVDEPSMCSESMLHIDLLLSQAFSRLKYYNAFPATQLRSSTAKYIEKTRAEAAKCPQVNITGQVDKLMSYLPRMIEKFLKTPNIMKNSADDVKNPVGSYNDLKSTQSQKSMVEKFPSLQLSLKHKFSDPVALLAAVESAVAQQKTKARGLCDELHALIQHLDERHKAIKSHAYSWSKYPVHAVLPNATDLQDFIEMLNRIRYRLSPDQQSIFLRELYTCIEGR